MIRAWKGLNRFDGRALKTGCSIVYLMQMNGLAEFEH